MTNSHPDADAGDKMIPPAKLAGEAFRSPSETAPHFSANLF